MSHTIPYDAAHVARYSDRTLGDRKQIPKCNCTHKTKQLDQTLDLYSMKKKILVLHTSQIDGTLFELKQMFLLKLFCFHKYNILCPMSKSSCSGFSQTLRWKIFLSTNVAKRRRRFCSARLPLFKLAAQRTKSSCTFGLNVTKPNFVPTFYREPSNSIPVHYVNPASFKLRQLLAVRPTL